jgi:molybdopterin molybdotransferase
MGHVMVGNAISSGAVKHNQSNAGSKREPELLPLVDAQSRLLAALPLRPSEIVTLDRAYGRVSSDDVTALLSHPPARVSAMDGYACRSEDIAGVPVRLRKIGISRAGERFEGPLECGTCVRIFTGGIVPEDANLIVLQEDATEFGDIVGICEVPRPGQFIRPSGLDFTAGDTCVRKGRVLTARDIGILAANGQFEIPVRRRPRVAILSTGDELVAPGRTPGRDQIVGSNGSALAAAVTGWGGTPVDLGIAPDITDVIAAAAHRAREADMLVTTGGASVGDHDLVRTSLAAPGLAPDFWRIAMRPGKPLTFGSLGELPVLGIPGKPAAALVCALLFLRPALRSMQGISPAIPPFERALLGVAMPANDAREDYITARIEAGPDQQIFVYPFRTQDGSMLMTLARADALIRRPAFAPPAKQGEAVDVIRLEYSANCL